MERFASCSALQDGHGEILGWQVGNQTCLHLGDFRTVRLAEVLRKAQVVRGEANVSPAFLTQLASNGTQLRI